MSFAWAAYLTLAEALFQARATFADEEACCRAAISRAYYAAFCVARNHARDNESLILSNTARDHQIVCAHYARNPNAQHKAIATTLHRLRYERNRADYDDQNIQRVEALTQNVLQQARQVLVFQQP